MTIARDPAFIKSGQWIRDKQVGIDRGSPLHPGIGLLAKLGSIVVHFEEYLSSNGHPFDRAALKTLLDDAEVQEWRKQMGPYLPVKR